MTHFQRAAGGEPQFRETHQAVRWLRLGRSWGEARGTALHPGRKRRIHDPLPPRERRPTQPARLIREQQFRPPLGRRDPVAPPVPLLAVGHQLRRDCFHPRIVAGKLLFA